MTKTPSTLMWLAEKRGLVNVATQTDRMAQELQQLYDNHVSKLAALDLTIQLYDEAIDPSCIDTIFGWQGRYSARGILRNALPELLGKYNAAWVSSVNLEYLLVASLGIDSSSEAART